jgi:hypothetical protein
VVEGDAGAEDRNCRALPALRLPAELDGLLWWWACALPGLPPPPGEEAGPVLGGREVPVGAGATGVRGEAPRGEPGGAGEWTDEGGPGVGRDDGCGEGEGVGEGEGTGWVGVTPGGWWLLLSENAQPSKPPRIGRELAAPTELNVHGPPFGAVQYSQCASSGGVC